MATSQAKPERHPDDRPTLGDVIELIWLPALGGIATAAITWLIWYYTIAPCTPELAKITGCNPALIARYISVDIFGRMLTYGAVVAGGLGFWRYEMIKRERAARIAAENRAIAIQQQAAEERRQAAAERERFMATMDELTTERQQAAADRQQAAEERQQAAADRQQAAADRHQAAEERLRLVDTINDLVAQQRNVIHESNDNSPNEQ